MLNLYGYCLSNIIYSCVMIYIISFIKNDDIKNFIDSFNSTLLPLSRYVLILKNRGE